MASDDVLVLGADLEGLAAAAALARAGRSVHLLDDGAPVGGMAAARPLGPDHHAPGLHVETGLVRRALLAPFELEGAGLAWHARPAPLHVLPGDGPALELPAGTEGRITHLESGDGPALAEWRAFLGRLAGLLREVVDEPPPEPADPSTGELFRLGKKALRLRGLGERDMMELLRVVTLPAWDWTEERFADPRLRAGLVAPALAGTRVGPRGAGTSALLLLRECLLDVEPVGGLAAVARALEVRCAALGVRIHRAARASRLRVEDGAVRAVELEDGAALDAALVVSAVDPARTLLELVEPGFVPRAVEHELAHWRAHGSSAVYLAALRVAPRFPGCEGTPARFVTAAAPVELERAADALKYGALPDPPWLDARLWTSDDPGCAPTGGATLVAQVHGVPAALAGDWDEEARATLRGRILDALERVAPGARELVAEDELLTPPDLEQVFGHRGGHLHRGELALDQLWAQRPCLELGRYGTPVRGLFLAGAGSHPGGPWFGGAGTLAARAAFGA